MTNDAPALALWQNIVADVARPPSLRKNRLNPVFLTMLPLCQPIDATTLSLTITKGKENITEEDQRQALESLPLPNFWLEWNDPDLGLFAVMVNTKYDPRTGEKTGSFDIIAEKSNVPEEDHTKRINILCRLIRILGNDQLVTELVAPAPAISSPATMKGLEKLRKRSKLPILPALLRHQDSTVIDRILAEESQDYKARDSAEERQNMINRILEKNLESQAVMDTASTGHVSATSTAASSVPDGMDRILNLQNKTQNS